MTFLFYGQDSFRIQERTRQTVKERVRPRGLDLSIIEFPRENFDSFREKIQAPSLFNNERVFILRNSFCDRNLSRRLAEYLETGFQILKDAILIFQEQESPNPKDPLFLFLQKRGKVDEFEPLSFGQTIKWIKDRQKSVSDEAAETLVAFFGNDLWRLAKEIEKLSCFKGGRQIETRDVMTLSRAQAETNIFKTIEAVASGNKKQALELISSHLKKGDSAVYLLAMVNYQFRHLLVVRDLLERKYSPFLIAKTARLKDFVVRKCCAISRKFSLTHLKRIYSLILKADIEIKTGKIPARQALEELILQI